MYGLVKEMKDTTLPSWGQTDQIAAQMMAPIVGALSHEVSVMGNLTANLHVLMASFYKPNGHRTKILIERDAFSSDYVCIGKHSYTKHANSYAGTVRRPVADSMAWA